jgi:hypothetical protein
LIEEISSLSIIPTTKQTLPTKAINMNINMNLNMNIHKLLYTTYFTDDVCDAIRKNVTTFGVAWKSYVAYHRNFEPINSKNAIFVMEEFRYLYAEITATIQLPRESFHRFLANRNVAI